MWHKISPTIGVADLPYVGKSRGNMRIPQRVSFGLSIIALCAVLPACGKSSTCARTSDCAAGLTCQRSSGKCVDPNSLEGATTGDQSTGTGSTGGTDGPVIAPGVAPAENELIITEIAPQRAPMHHVPNGELEFIELFNVSSKKLELGGLSLVVKLTSRVRDPGEDPGVETVLPLEGTLEANARLVVARNGALISDYYPQAQVLHRPTLRLNTVVHPGNERITYRNLKVLLKNATQTLDESKFFNDGALENSYLVEPYPSTKALRGTHTAWRKYGSLRGVSRQARLGDNSDRNVESWGTPGARNESADDSVYKEKLVFTQISASTPAYRNRQARNAKGLVGIGAGVFSSMDLIEIRNVSTETIDVIGMVLEQHTTHYNSFPTGDPQPDSWAVAPSTTPGQSRSIVSPIVIGKTPVKRSAPNGLAGADAANRAHLNLAPGESIVLARNPEVVAQAMIQKRVSSAAPFTATELTSLGIDSAYRITAGLAGYHSGYVIPATIALGSQSDRNYIHFVLRDRQGNKIDQAGGLGTTTEWGNGNTVPNGFHKMGRGGLWHADLSKSRASRGNWFPVGKAGHRFGKVGQEVTAAQCGDIISGSDRTCFLIGLVMQEFP